ncbi:hypothetical protein ACP70R_010859 [Stipagrostis hirtigluma subsp. patula]
MAALRPCPSGPIVGARPLSVSNQSPPRITPPLGRRNTSLLISLKTSAGRTTAPRLRHHHENRAGRGSLDFPFHPDPDDGKKKPMTEEEFNKFREEFKKFSELDKDMPFLEEIEKTDEYSKKMSSWNTSIFHMEATQFSLYLCMIVGKGVKFASRIMDSAAIRHDNQDEISLNTTKQTITMYVSIFVQLAEDTYNKKFNHESVFSLLGAFGGLASISHIMFQDALANLNYADVSSLKYSSLGQDIENSRREYQQKMKNLEQNFRASFSCNSKAYKLLRPTMTDAMILTMYFVFKMVARRETVIGKGTGYRVRRALRQSFGRCLGKTGYGSKFATLDCDDGEPDASATSSDSTSDTKAFKDSEPDTSSTSSSSSSDTRASDDREPDAWSDSDSTSATRASDDRDPDALATRAPDDGEPDTSAGSEFNVSGS